MASISRLSTAAQFFEEDGGGSEAISTYDRVSWNFLMKVTSDLDPDPWDLDLESASKSIWIFKMKIFGVAVLKPTDENDMLRRYEIDYVIT